MALSSAIIQPLPDVRWTGAFILVPVLLGLLIWVVPVHWVLLAIVAAGVAFYLGLNPDKCFYLVVFTIPFTERIRVLPVSFSLNDLCLLLAVALVGLHIILKGQFVSIRTKLDPWLMVLTGMFFLAGLFSESDRGMLGFLKFFEAIVVYYMMAFMLRSGYLTRANVLKVVLWTVLFQAGLGILQSLTGGFGAEFVSNRGYLGYLGIGSSMVWHGHGTMDQFNTLGYFLSISFLVFLGIYCSVVRRRKWAIIAAAVILSALLMTYSRGALLALITGGLYVLFITQEKPKKAATIVAAVLGLIILPTFLFYLHSSYADTLSFQDRLMIWQVPMTAIMQNAKSFWLGSGLNSYEVVAWPYIPGDVHMSDYYKWFAHNWYLLSVLELGVLGTAVLLAFLVYICRDTLRIFRESHGFQSMMGLALSAGVFSIFFASIFDHSYGSTYFRIYLFLLLGLLYVHPQRAFKHH